LSTGGGCGIRVFRVKHGKGEDAGGDTGTEVGLILGAGKSSRGTGPAMRKT